ncbi:unnamed protein product [Rangifer tarandus platyrhynchus]|uniref:Uncharacterized protein n=1 Tax=Rangifer tarandus platyrhynchus TaxID=3082113 RepID=A0ABN8YAT3_RANTA|nr:unnamed protein product [Rangifer tarandus platyrhynchus]
MPPAPQEQGGLRAQLPQVGTQNLVLPQLTYGQGRPLVVSSGHEKPIETRRDTKDRGHRGHSHACSWFVPHVCFHLRPESDVPAGRGCERPHKAWWRSADEGGLRAQGQARGGPANSLHAETCGARTARGTPAQAEAVEARAPPPCTGAPHEIRVTSEVRVAGAWPAGEGLVPDAVATLSPGHFLLFLPECRSDVWPLVAVR